VEGLEFSSISLDKAAGARSTSRFDVVVVYEKKIDAAAECERLKKDLEKFESELGRAKAQLGNEGFLAKAPVKVVDGLRNRASELEVLIQKTQSGLAELACK
jgi:valyl-tRNA synthetase